MARTLVALNVSWSIVSRSVLSTKISPRNLISIPLICDANVETCPPFLYTLIMRELSISQHARAAPLP
jgi:hypothetical protein